MEERDNSQTMSYSEKYVHAMMRRFRPPRHLASRAAKLMNFYAKKNSSSGSNRYHVNTSNTISKLQSWEEITIPEIPRTRGFNSRRVFLRRKKELSECNNKENVHEAVEIINTNNNKRAFSEKVEEFDNGISNVNDIVKREKWEDDMQVINVHIPSIQRHVSQEHKKNYLQCTVQTAENQSKTEKPLISDRVTPITVSTQHASKMINETNEDQRAMLQKSNKEKKQLCHDSHSLLQSIRVFTPTSSVIQQETDVVRHGKCTKSKSNNYTWHSQRKSEKENDSRDKHFPIEPTLHKKQLSSQQIDHKNHVRNSHTNTAAAAVTVNPIKNNNKANVNYQFHSHIMAPEQLYEEHEMTCMSPDIYLQKEIEEISQSSNSQEINDSYNSDTCNSVNKRESSSYNCSNDSSSDNNSNHSDCEILVSEHIKCSEEFRWRKSEQLTEKAEREKRWIQQSGESFSNGGSDNNDDKDDALSFEITEMYDPDIALEDAWNEVQTSKDDSDWFSTPEKTISWLEKAKPPRWKARRAIMSPRQILY